jgi:hypothetical protein
MAKQNLNIGSSANDGLGDSLRDGAIKLNNVIDEIYSTLGNETNLQVNIGSPAAGQVLRWTGSVFSEAHLDSLSADLNVNTFKIISEANGDVTIQPNGTGKIKLWGGGTGDALTYIDGADGKLRYSNFVDDLTDLPDAATHHGMFIHVHNEAHGYFAHSGAWTQLLDTGSSIGDMDDVDLTVGGGPADGQVLKWNTTNSKWEPANDIVGDSEGGGTTQNLFETINADSGSTTASAATDVLTIAGGTNISTAITGDTVTINMTGALGDPDQNLFSVIGSDSGSKTANSTATPINFVGGTGISTAINGDNLTITNDSPNVTQEVYRTVSGDSGSTTAALATSTLTVAGGTGITTAVTSNTVTVNLDSPLPSATDNDTLIYDEDNSQWVVAESAAVGFRISAFGSSAYTFDGGGIDSNTNNPTFYVYRGFTYRFNNTAGAAHPFALRQTNGGSAVTQGVTGSQTGVQYWTVPMTLSAGTTYVYQCTIHSGMVGNIVVV